MRGRRAVCHARGAAAPRSVLRDRRIRDAFEIEAALDQLSETNLLRAGLGGHHAFAIRCIGAGPGNQRRLLTVDQDCFGMRIDADTGGNPGFVRVRVVPCFSMLHTHSNMHAQWMSVHNGDYCQATRRHPVSRRDD